MKPLVVLNPSREPGDMAPIERAIDVSAHQVCHGLVAHEGAVLRVTTADKPWHYTLRFPFPIDLAAERTDLNARVRAGAAVQRGQVGLGVVRPDGSTFIAERCFAAGSALVEVSVPARELEAGCQIVFRNAALEGTSEFVLADLSVVYTPPAADLHAVTRQPFTAHAKRSRTFELASINTTEVCNLSCVMCHFNGPSAVKKSSTLRPEQVEKVLTALPEGEDVWFCATGEFFLDEHAVGYLRRATALGLKPGVMTHGQLFTPELIDQVLEAGVRFIRMSVDSTDPDQYRKIRRGGELSRILEACHYLRRQKAERYPDLRVEINATLFKKTFDQQKAMEEFWRPLVDQVNFNAEYFDIFRFRNVFHVPDRRSDCDIRLYVMPSGRIAPCCAVAVYQHDHDVSWLPHIDTTPSLDEAYRQLCDMYEDPESPLGKLCESCDWWILFGEHKNGATPYNRCVSFAEPRQEGEPLDGDVTRRETGS